MTTIQSLRDGTVKLISENPTTITIHRTEYKDDGAGGRYKDERDLPSFVGRLVPSKQQVQKRQNEAGEMQSSGWTLIAPWDADIRAGSDVEDAFLVKGKLYRVTRAIKRAYQGEVYAVHAAVEELF